MIIRENIIDIEEQELSDILEREDLHYKPEELIFFDLEHYVYKKPKCVGVFGACVFDEKDKNKVLDKVTGKEVFDFSKK